MSIDNPNKFWTKKDLEFARMNIRNIAEIVHKKPTQRESQMKNSILNVLNTLNKHDKLNTTQIMEKTGLWSQSVNRVVKLLRERDIVSVTQHHDKQNNEKIYILNKNRAIIYGDHILNYKLNVKNQKRLNQKNDSWHRFVASFPEQFLEWWVYFSPKTTKRKNIEYSPPVVSDRKSLKDKPGAFVLIRSLYHNHNLIEYLFRHFYSGNYCHWCFTKHLPREKPHMMSNIEEYKRKHSSPEEIRRRYGVDVEKMPIITELQKQGDYFKCLLCGRVQHVEDEGPARERGKRRKYDAGTKEGFKTSLDKIMKASKKSKSKIYQTPPWYNLNF